MLSLALKTFIRYNFSNYLFFYAHTSSSFPSFRVLIEPNLFIFESFRSQKNCEMNELSGIAVGFDMIGFGVMYSLAD